MMFKSRTLYKRQKPLIFQRFFDVFDTGVRRGELERALNSRKPSRMVFREMARALCLGEGRQICRAWTQGKAANSPHLCHKTYMNWKSDVKDVGYLAFLGIA
jgi:hypothetical protein